MSKHIYNTQGTCARQIEFEIEDNRIKNVQFIGGCNGNLKAISSLVEGMEPQDAIKRLSGITCGFKATSCGDQFSQALKEAIASAV